MLNPASPLPLYHQLAELLSGSIARGELGPGARLPSDPALSRQHRIGRPTVRQATELLVNRGLVERRTYVTSGPRRIDLFSLAGTLSSFEKSGVALESRLVQRVKRRKVARDLENPFSEREAYTFARIGRVEKRPVLFERLYLEPSVFPELERVPLAGESLSRVVKERYFLEPTHAEQSFRAARPALDVRHALELGAREAALLVKRTLHFPRAPQAIFSELFCRTEELLFTQTIGQPPRRESHPHHD